MDGEIDVPVEQRLFELFDEEPFPTNPRQRDIKHRVTSRFDYAEFDLFNTIVRGKKLSLDESALSQC
jgi:hypothetical protein